MTNRMGILARGAVAGLVGTVSLQGLRTASQKWIPGTMAPVRKEPGAFMVERAEAELPDGPRAEIPASVETAAAKSLAMGYGMTAGVLYGLLRPRGGDVLTDGALLGLGTWAAGYLGWLPQLGLMPPLPEQEAEEVVGPAVRHALFGIVTVAAYRALSR